MRTILVGILIAMAALAGCMNTPDGLEEPGMSDDSDSQSQTDPIPGATGPGSRERNGEQDEPAPETGPKQESEQDPEQDPDAGSGSDPENTRPVAFLEASHNGIFIPFTVAFEADGWDPDGEPVRWRLDYGDGHSTEGHRLPVTVEHTYEKAGVFEAQLLVTDGKDWTVRTTTIDASVKPVPLSLKGTVNLPDSVDIVDGGCISEAMARTLVDAFNEAARAATDEANSGGSDANATIHEIYETLNRTLVDAGLVGDEGLGSLPFSIPAVPHEAVDYFEGPTWNYHALDPEVWGWPYAVGSGDVIAEFRADNGTLLEQGTHGVAPPAAAMVVVCAKPIPADEDELPGGIVLGEEYELVLEPPIELLQKAGPQDVEATNQIFEGGYEIGRCGVVYVPEFENVDFAALESIDPATHGNTFRVAFESTVPAVLYFVAFFDDGEFLETSESDVPEWEGTIPDGATQAFFTTCGGVEVNVSYVGEA